MNPLWWLLFVPVGVYVVCALLAVVGLVVFVRGADE